ncbi:hypothetical protein [Nissabacter sp. SGAir0207]|uniref:hypothetical protein n=1 Tax=Nissabacter sp. SGAir0207 TaxID=2126321 RepID=UPI0010CD6A4C|nr:hypothetical protein [Nissabacter sp. SGAir0207]QCR38713.1 hypothetical protein C1N62_21485 [Nissabacter sp. SGAir0207]
MNTAIIESTTTNLMLVEGVQMASVQPKRKLLARAYELTKGDGEARDGRILMSIEGPRDFIEWAEADLEQDFVNVKIEEEGKNEDEIGLIFGLDRADKSVFMARWKQLKAAWKKGQGYPASK